MANPEESSIPTFEDMPYVYGPCDYCATMIGEIDENEPFFWTEIVTSGGELDMAFVCKRCLVNLYQQGQLACDFCGESTMDCTCNGEEVKATRYDGCFTCTGRYSGYLDEEAVKG